MPQVVRFTLEDTPNDHCERPRRAAAASECEPAVHSSAMLDAPIASSMWPGSPTPQNERTTTRTVWRGDRAYDASALRDLDGPRRFLLSLSNSNEAQMTG